MSPLVIILLSLIVLLILSVVFYRQFFKRFWDIVLSGLAIIILSPTLLILTILGRIKMKGSPFFVYPRPGRKQENGEEKIFNLIKFRSMTEDKDESGNYLPDEVRLTKYGRILRSTSLDELPELFNIFRGDMSIVGPRPLSCKYLDYYTTEEHHRHDVRPGLTGLAQVNGRNAISWEERFNFDLKYVKNISLKNDLKIIIKTFVKVLKRADIGDGNASLQSLHELRERNNKGVDL